MKNSISFVGALALPLFVLVGCGGGGGKKDAGTPADLSGGDMTAAVTCTQVSAWPTTDVSFVGQPDPISGIDFLTAAYENRANPTSSSLTDTLQIEVWDSASAPSTYPTTFTFASTDTYNSCTGCVSLFVGVDFNDPQSTPGTFFFAQSGSMTVTKADRDPNMGMFAATGTNVHLVEWSYTQSDDMPVPNGKCFDIASFTASGTYTNTNDGGTTD